jgi:hypothetical protein
MRSFVGHNTETVATLAGEAVHQAARFFVRQISRFASALA